MQLSGYGPRQRSKRRVIVLQRGTCQSCGILLLTSTYSELSSSIGTLLIVVLLLERWIWYLLWKSTQLCSVTRRFKLTNRLQPGSSRKVIVSAFHGEI
ncbi:hypothetical protein Gotur_023292 [Gossypium turneri]